MRTHFRILLLAAAVMALAACGKQPSADTSTVLATVNGTPVTTDMFRAYVRSLAGGQEPALDAQKRALVLDRLVDMEVLAQQADKEGVSKDPKVAADLGILRTRLLAQQMVQTYLAKHPVTDEQIKAEYEKRIKGAPAQEYRARHILVASEQQAKDIIAKLNHGASFAALAKQYSTDTFSGKKGGDLGWFNPADMVPQFAQALARLKPGQYTRQPVHTQYGWHVIELQGTRPLAPPSLASVRQQITNELEGREIEAYVNQLRGAAKVTVTAPAAASQAPAPAASTAKPVQK